MTKKRIEVAVGVIKRKNQVLVGQRLVQDQYFQKWEFPGGKLDNDEKPLDALSRELLEELGIEVVSARPLITLEHDYPDRHVRLYVFEVNHFFGEPKGVEGQALKWVAPSECHHLDFLEANTPIIHAIQLPSLMFITDIERYGIDKTVDVLRGKNEEYHSSLIIQLREPNASRQQLIEYLRILRLEADNALIFLNGDVALAYDLGFDGVQLNRHRIKLGFQRPNSSNFWIGVSCHNSDELSQAEKIADYALLSPIKKTSSHPEAMEMGWEAFETLIRPRKLPCYALGGLSMDEVHTAWQHGAQGVAAISSVWSGE